MSNKLKEIEDFLGRESSILERGKRYQEDVGVLVGMIYSLRLYISNMRPINTADISKEEAYNFVQQVMALVDEYRNKPKVCGG